MWIQNGPGNWKNIANDDKRCEVVVIDEPEGQVVVKFEKQDEKVLIDVPEGQVVLKKARKPRKKNTIVKAI